MCCAVSQADEFARSVGDLTFGGQYFGEALRGGMVEKRREVRWDRINLCVSDATLQR